MTVIVEIISPEDVRPAEPLDEKKVCPKRVPHGLLIVFSGPESKERGRQFKELHD